MLVNKPGGPANYNGWPISRVVTAEFRYDGFVCHRHRRYGIAWNEIEEMGRVIASTSSIVMFPIPIIEFSNALRMSLAGWSKTLAREVGADGITANVILPGRIATNRILALDGAKAERENSSVEAVSQESKATISVGRYRTPKEYDDVVAFLASEAASYVTGSVIRVDHELIASI